MSEKCHNWEVRTCNQEVGFAFKNGHHQSGLPGPKSGRRRQVRAKSAASLPCRLSPFIIRVGGVLLAREQRRLAAIITADVVGYPHAAYEQINYSSLVPRTYLCVRLLETLD
jgi:hypothetical protein